MTREGAGVSAAGPMWHEFIIRALKDIPVETFTKPDPNFSDKIMLNGQYTYDSGSGNQEIHSILYYINKDDPLSTIPSNSINDPQFKNWESAVRRYYNLPYQDSIQSNISGF